MPTFHEEVFISFFYFLLIQLRYLCFPHALLAFYVPLSRLFEQIGLLEIPISAYFFGFKLEFQLLIVGFP